MPLDKQSIERAIKDKIIEIADRMGDDARELRSDEMIPATGLIDSASLLELLVWYERHFEIALPQEDITIDNLGTLSAMADFVLRRKMIH
jgi:D-alanine--poly(phosphoribitol) ligase subunit 2